MTRDFVLLGEFHTISVQQAVPWLGRIVQFYRNPLAGYTPESGEVLIEEPYEDNNYTNVRMIASRLSSKQARADLLGLFGFTLESNSDQFHELEAHSVQRLRIHNDDLLLKKLLQNQSVIERLESWKFTPMKPVFMVVGLLIADGISYREKSLRGNTIGGYVDPGQIAAVAGGVPIPRAMPIGATVHDQVTDRSSMFAEGRRVFAIEYRVLQKKMTLFPWGSVSKHNTKLRAHGPQDDRAFNLENHLKTSREATIEEPEVVFVNEALDEFVDEEDEKFVFSIEEEVTH